MLKIKQIYAKKSPSEAGFTLLEVLVAMLIAFFFVLGSMQALVLSTALRVKAQENQRANQLIQEDIEQILFTAKELAPNNSLCNATAYNGSYAQYLFNNLPTKPGNKQLLNGKGKTYELFRTPASGSTAKVLKINFEVKALDGSNNPVGDALATDHIEVIPNAAIEQCPN